MNAVTTPSADLSGPELRSVSMARMRPDTAEIAGRRLRYAVSDNPERGGVALNIHGWFAGGGMYWRESARLAETLGWTMVNPSLPGFGGSDRLELGTDAEGSVIDAYADRLAALLDHLDEERAVVLGHSMGGAVAVAFAYRHPTRCAGVIYRDGAGTPAWRHPSIGRLATLAALEAADMLGGGMNMVRGVWPDFLRNARSPGASLPAALELLSIDQRQKLGCVTALGIPSLCVWGRADRLTSAAAAQEFCQHAGGEPVFVKGCHSWMLPRPWLQAELLRDHPAGRAFMEAAA